MPRPLGPLSALRARSAVPELAGRAAARAAEAVVAVAAAGAVLVAAGALAACSSDDSGEPAPPLADPFGYKTPEDFPRAQCAAGSLASLPTTAVYHGLASTGDGAVYTVPMRVRPGAGGALTGLVYGREVTTVTQTGDDLILRELRKDAMTATHWCGMSATGELTGSYVSCSSRGCLVAPMIGRQVLPLDEAAEHNLSLIGRSSTAIWGPRPFAVNVRVTGGTAYVARYGAGLGIVDVRDPSTMIHLADLPVEAPPSEIYNDVKIVEANGKRYALMASNVNGVVVVDVTTARLPKIVAHFGLDQGEATTNVHTLAIEGTRAYLANTRTGLDIFDVSDPVHAVKLGHFSHPALTGYLHDLYVKGNRAYLNWWNAGMAIVDVTDPANPLQLGNFDNYGQRTSHSSWELQIGARKIALHGDEQYGAHLNVVDVTDGSPRFGKSIASWMTRPEVSIHNVMAMGNLAVLAYYQDGVRVLDLSDPENPSPVAWYNTWAGPSGENAARSFFDGACGVDVDAANRIIYVADIERGLLALRLASGI